MSAATTFVTGSTREVREIFKRAQAGDRESLDQVRELARNPQCNELLGGNLAKDTRQLMMRDYCGNDVVVSAALEQTITSMRSELQGDHPSPLELLLFDRIVTCWLRLHIVGSRFLNETEMTM